VCISDSSSVVNRTAQHRILCEFVLHPSLMRNRITFSHHLSLAWYEMLLEDLKAIRFWAGLDLAENTDGVL
jgi:hypothetical protein